MTDAYTHRRRIVFGDCDPGGIVYTPRVSHFVVEAGLAFLGARLGRPAERYLLELGIGPPARSLDIDFLAPMTWDDELDIRVTVKEIRTHALTLAMAAHVGETNTFNAELVMVCVALESFRAAAIPDRLREALSDR